MRHRTILSLALILGLVPALNTTPLFAMQDEQQAELCEDMVTVGEETFRLDCTDTPPGEFSEGLRVTAGPEAESADRLYAVQFIGEGEDESNPMEGAYIPERFNNQAMVVKVLDGQFAFRTQGPGVIVDAQDQPLERYTASIPIGLGENPNIQAANAGMTRSYYEDGEFPCDLSVDGHVVCLLDEEVFKDEVSFVRLDPGDTVFLPGNSTCFLCNTIQIGSTPAELLIWTPETGFNGDLESIATAMATASSGTAAVQGSGRNLGWMFNPGSTCK